HSLCLNGIKYTEKGKVTLHIQRLNEDLIGSCKVRFDIIDTGIGIRESELKHIFSAFNRVNKKGPYKQFEGAGLGLAIVKKLVAIMGGNIEVQSDPGKGSTFS
ncbi:ATP-binding protein, partial [Arthrospira platensis SPKY2]